ncbi:MAG: peptidoglycan editing factor PgeF [Myxococcota bacterium]
MLLKVRALSEAGVAHGFATRVGGVSEGPFAALNLARNVGDAPEAVAENHRRLAEAVGYGRLYEVSQVHGDGVRVVDGKERPEDVRAEEADALIGRGRGFAVAVRVADCAPLLLADAERELVAAVHCGWRGVAAALAPAVVRRLVALGARPEALRAALGPHIRAPRFEVGEEVAAPLVAAAGGDASVVDRTKAKPHVDLAAILRRQLAEVGVRILEDAGGCTYDEPARFFSHRRDAGLTGRHLAVVGLP